MPAPAVVLPLGALFVAFFAVAIPTILLMTVWSAITMARVLFPERPLPFGPRPRRQPTFQGRPVSVRARDIQEDQARRALAHAEAGAESPPEVHPLFDDLWLRRN